MTLLKLELHDAVTDYAVDFRDPSVQVDAFLLVSVKYRFILNEAPCPHIDV